MTPGISEISRQAYSIHMLMFWWCVAIGVFVFGWMIYSLVPLPQIGRRRA